MTRMIFIKNRIKALDQEMKRRLAYEIKREKASFIAHN